MRSQMYMRYFVLLCHCEFALTRSDPLYCLQHAHLWGKVPINENGHKKHD